MKMGNTFKKVAVITGSVLMAVGFSACSAVTLQPGAQKVMVSNDPAPKTCKFLGTITANQGNFFTGVYTSNKNLQEGAFNDMRNQAVALGGNRVVLLMATAASTGGGSFSNGTGEMSSGQTNVALTGNVFACPGQ